MSHHFDTVSFDVRDNTTMLFFARTGEDGEIGDYMLIMRTINDDFEETLTLEVNEEQLSGDDLITEARIIGNTLTLRFGKDTRDWLGKDELTVSFEETDDNFTSMESGAFRVLGDVLVGGNA